MYPSQAALEEAIITFFASFSGERALRLTVPYQQETRAPGESWALAA